MKESTVVAHNQESLVFLQIKAWSCEGSLWLYRIIPLIIFYLLYHLEGEGTRWRLGKVLMEDWDKVNNS